MCKTETLRLVSFIFLLFPLLTKAFVNSPQVNCVSVLANGDVTLDWSAPPDPGSEFVSYNIFVSNTLTGSYTGLAPINSISTTSYTYAGAAANTIPKFFYITTTSSDGSTQPATDTVRTIFLVVNNPGNGIAYLSWNPVADPLHASSGVSYSVYREYPAGVYTILGTTTDTRWKDTIDICDFTFNYYVSIPDANSCSSVSNIVSAHLSDETAPKIPGLDSVSVNNASGQTIIGLSPSASPDATCYIIYQKVGFSYLAIDTVCGNVPLVYTVNNSAPTAGSESYGIASIDSCGNLSPISQSQNTLFLTSSYSLCGKSVLLGWNPYIHMQNGLSTYQIYVSVNGSPFTFCADTTNLSYTVQNLVQNKTYQFFVRAVDSTGTVTSTSNIVSFFSKAQPTPTFVYVKSVSVNTAQTIDIGIQVDDTSGVTGLAVYRSLSLSGAFTLIGHVNCSAGNPSYYINDAHVETATTEYYYKAVAIDSCGLPSITSNISKSVVLSVISNPDRTNSLSWTDYQMYLGNVATWNVYRSVDDVFDPVPIAALPGSTLNYIDDVSSFVPNSGRFNYYVQAAEGPGNPYGLMELSNSNIVETYHTDSVFIPNAFTPHGHNKLWLPMTQYVEKTEYKVSVFDRWGEKVWETQSDSEGWDGGKYEGGLYAYVVEYKNAFGEYKRLNGTVLMIR